MAAGLETANATVSSTAVATKPEESPPVDEIVLRLEVEDHCTLPVHLLYNCSTPDMATSEGLCGANFTLPYLSNMYRQADTCVQKSCL